MFPPPRVIEAEVFACLPDSLRKDGVSSEWLEMQLAGAGAGWPRHSFLEGPAFDRDGNLYCVDIPFGRVFRVTPEGEWEVAADYDGNPNGLAIHRDGRLFIADCRLGVMVMEPESGHVEPFFQRSAFEHLKGVNDLFFATNGDLYVTDMGQSGLQDPTGKLYRIRPDGAHEILLDNVPGPNGLVLNLAETALYLAATRLNAVWTCPLTRHGMPTRVGTFVTLQGGMGPDGLALDTEGSLAVAHVGFGAVWLFSARGEPLVRIEPPEGCRLTSNLAYGGPDNRDLYITEAASGQILRARMEVPGKPLFSHA
ncbi:MAG: SMP-30/gluconolactonase/LRE family protein [Alphaproteobacteria bacterium]|nr:SMP-30/gluconolactonase/LRE family protein [Alphaproteobacteria bacterium]